MKRKVLLFSVAVCISYGTAWAQRTSYGGLTQGTAGNGGNTSNSYFGTDAGINNTGTANTFIGRSSGISNTTGNDNTFVGFLSGSSNITGDGNTAIGREALYNNISGDYNTAVGYRSLFFNTANANTAVGRDALYSNTTGWANTAIGSLTLDANTTGSANTAVGGGALTNNNIGNYNIAIGPDALHDNTSGHNNIANGYRALYNTTNGDYNTAVGRDALFHNDTGNGNTAIGGLAGPNAGTRINTTAIGYQATTTASNQVRIGNVSVTSIGGFAWWSNVSDGRFKKDIKEDIPGLAFIEQLRPISYELDRSKLRTFLGKEETEKSTTSQSYRREIGFIAQEVEQVLTENGYTPIGIETPQNEQDHYSIRYAEFVVPLTKAVQELSTANKEQQELIKILQEQNETLNQRLDAVEALVAGTVKETSGNTQTKNTDTGSFTLYQNVPNPFHQTTTVSALVPESVQQAKIVIYNLQGLELDSYLLTGRGSVSVEISGGKFPSGMYTYGLIADGRLINTKKMILTK